jgi:O-antigen ligase
LLIGFTFLSIISISYLLYENNYLLLTPDYNKTITHKDFDNLVSATTKGEDISTMERVYRWVAGIHMIKEKPFFGFGPGSFYTFYKSYTVSSFKTYVSDNPDHSTVHNYFLLTWIEQGIVGFMIFIALCFMVLIVGEKVYNDTSNKEDRAFVLAAIMSFVVILLLNLINDMIETDKVGPFFFLSMAIIIFYKNKISEIGAE